ncbi:MAG: hypothetical protein IPH98_14855 [Saprospiraceae bacterium]|jgi:hypothetical protein|nr:hypothetical protein [Candidatus Defluviibacterium haderslevense]
MDLRRNHINQRVLVYAILWIASYTCSILTLKSFNLPVEVGLVLTIVTILAFSVFIYKYYRSIFFMDEVQIKIQMEAIVIAFSLGLMLLMTLGLLDLFITLNKEDWSYRHIVPLFATFYFTGLYISKRKYHYDHEKHD